MSADVSFPLAGAPLSDAEIVVALDEMSAAGCVVVLITEQGDRRVGRSVCFVRGTEDVLGVLERLGSPPAGITLHALHAGELVSSSRPPVDCENCGHVAHYGDRCSGACEDDGLPCCCSWPDPGNYPDPGAVTVRSLLWSVAGVGGVLTAYTVFVSSFWTAMGAAFGV